VNLFFVVVMILKRAADLVRTSVVAVLLKRSCFCNRCQMSNGRMKIHDLSLRTCL